MARFHDISQDISQNGQVSPKYVKKASLSPCFQNGLGKSPLDILRFPSGLAFSHKELMGHFEPITDFIVKMMKCRQCARGRYRVREGVDNTPDLTAASCFW